MTQHPPVRVFKNPEALARYREAYRSALAQWPVPFEEIDIESPFGRTHVVAAGDPALPPMTLLHAAGASSTMWGRHIGALAKVRRVYAADTPGDTNLTAPVRVPESRPACALWLADVFDGLGIDRTDVAGFGYGGFLAVNLAIHLPDRVNRLVVIDLPASSIRPGSRLLARIQARTGARGGPAVKVRAAGISEVELRSLRMPALLLSATRSEVSERAAKLMRDAKTEVLPEDGFAERIARFLADTAPTARTATAPERLLP